MSPPLAAPDSVLNSPEPLGLEFSETSLDSTSLSISTGLPRRRARRKWSKFWKDEVLYPLLRFGAFYLVLLLGLIVCEERLIFPGGWEHSDIRAMALDAVQKATGRTVEEVAFSAPDGPKLNGWFVPGEPDAPVVLLLHGNGGDISAWSRMQMEVFAASKASVLAMDYRGYGRSAGWGSERGVLADARAGRKWLAERCGVREDEIVLCGRSLGGAVAIDLAQDGARALMTECTFTSLPDVAEKKFFIFPVRAVMRHEMNSLEKIRRVKCPTYIVHGDADGLIPCEQSERLFTASGAAQKRFVKLRDVEHFAPWSESQWKARAAFFRWLEAPDAGLDLDAPTPPYIQIAGQTVGW